MQFKIKELKDFLSSITKHKIEKIHIKSEDFNLTVNARQLIGDRQFSHNVIKRQNIVQTKLNINKQTIDNHFENENDIYFTIVSPMIGTFYRSPAPNEPSFIEINDLVKINQTVCIIEAMKLMNEIESEVNGHIIEILVQDGDIVDCGQALMLVRHQEKA